MKKKLPIVTLLVCMLAGIIFPASGLALEYTPGPQTAEFTFEEPVSLSGAEVSGTTLIMGSGSEAVYDLFLEANTVKLTVLYTVSDDVQLTLLADSETVTVSLPAGSTSAETSVGWSRGSYVFKICADKAVTLTGIVLEKEKTRVGSFNTEIIDMSDYESKLQSSVVVGKDASAIKVNGAMRYVDYDNPYLVPELINGRLYLPTTTVATAFSLYSEDYPELSYVYLSNDSFELYSGAEGQYVVSRGIKTQLEDFVIYKNGRAWLPLRQLAELLGLTVHYSNGLAIIDDRVRIKNIVTDDALMGLLKEEFNECICAPSPDGKVYHVSKAANASDTNVGSASMPFATIQRAAESVQAGDTVIIHEGTYREEVIVPTDGTAAKPIIFRAAEGEDVVISAFNEYTGFTLHDEAKGIYKTKVDSIGFDRNFITYNNGNILREGRHPDSNTSTVAKGYTGYDDSFDLTMYPTIGDIRMAEGERGEAPYCAESPIDLNQTEPDYWKGGTYVGMFSAGWSLSYGEIVSSEPGKIYFNGVGGSYGFNYETWNSARALDYGFITNHYNTVNLPGEWYLDDATDTLYIIPPDGVRIENFTIEAKQRQRVIDLTNRKYVHFQNINTCGGGITMAGDSRMCVINGGEHRYISHGGKTFGINMHNLRFYKNNIWEPDAPQLGETGFYADGDSNAFVNMRINYSAGAGLYLTGKYTLVQNNLIEHAGYAGGYPGGIWVSTMQTETSEGAFKTAGGHIVFSNTVSGSGRGVLSLLSGKAYPDTATHDAIAACDIGYNDFRYGSISARDSGVVYLWGITAGTDFKRTRIHHNIIRDNATQYAQNISAGQFILYHDGWSTMFEDYGNIVWTSDEEFISGNGNLADAKAFIFTQEETNAEANVMYGANRVMNVFTGDKVNLSAGDYPYAKPFYAGSELEQSERFMLNYNKAAEDINIRAAEAVCSGDAYIDSDGYGVITQEGDSLTFQNLKLYPAGTKIDVYYISDKLKTSVTDETPPELRLAISSEAGCKESAKAPLVYLSPYSQTIMKKTFAIEGTEEKSVDISVSFKGNLGDMRLVSVSAYMSDYETEGNFVYNEYPARADVVYLGGYDEQLSGETASAKYVPSYTAEEKGTFSALETYIHPNNSTCLLYRDVEFENASGNCALRYSIGYQTSVDALLEIRIDNPESEPVCVYDLRKAYDDVAKTGWNNFVAYGVLSSVIPSGCHDVYVTYKVSEDTTTAGLRTIDSYYISFY